MPENASADASAPPLKLLVAAARVGGCWRKVFLQEPAACRASSASVRVWGRVWGPVGPAVHARHGHGVRRGAARACALSARRAPNGRSEMVWALSLFQPSKIAIRTSTCKPGCPAGSLWHQNGGGGGGAGTRCDTGGDTPARSTASRSFATAQMPPAHHLQRPAGPPDLTCGLVGRITTRRAGIALRHGSAAPQPGPAAQDDGPFCEVDPRLSIAAVHSRRRLAVAGPLPSTRPALPSPRRRAAATIEARRQWRTALQPPRQQLWVGPAARGALLAAASPGAWQGRPQALPLAPDVLSRAPLRSLQAAPGKAMRRCAEPPPCRSPPLSPALNAWPA